MALDDILRRIYMRIDVVFRDRLVEEFAKGFIAIAWFEL